jgi:hypothetical protein
VHTGSRSDRRLTGRNPRLQLASDSSQLAKNPLSDNVGVVKSGVRHPLYTKRHFALVEKPTCQPTTARLVILSGQNSVRPMHLFGRYCDHDYQFELLARGAGAHSIARCSTTHRGDFRVAPRANRTRPTADNPITGASSSTNKRPADAPWRPWRSSVPAASSGESIGCAIRKTPHRDLRRFYQ